MTAAAHLASRPSPRPLRLRRCARGRYPRGRIRPVARGEHRSGRGLARRRQPASSPTKVRPSAVEFLLIAAGLALVWRYAWIMDDAFPRISISCR